MNLALLITLAILAYLTLGVLTAVVILKLAPSPGASVGTTTNLIVLWPLAICVVCAYALGALVHKLAGHT